MLAESKQAFAKQVKDLGARLKEATKQAAARARQRGRKQAAAELATTTAGMAQHYNLTLLERDLKIAHLVGAVRDAMLKFRAQEQQTAELQQALADVEAQMAQLEQEKGEVEEDLRSWQTKRLQLAEENTELTAALRVAESDLAALKQVHETAQEELLAVGAYCICWGSWLDSQ